MSWAEGPSAAKTLCLLEYILLDDPGRSALYTVLTLIEAPAATRPAKRVHHLQRGANFKSPTRSSAGSA